MADILKPGQTLQLPDGQVAFTVSRVDPVKPDQMAAFELSTKHAPFMVPESGYTGDLKDPGVLKNTSSPGIRLEVIYKRV